MNTNRDGATTWASQSMANGINTFSGWDWGYYQAQSPSAATVRGETGALVTTQVPAGQYSGGDTLSKASQKGSLSNGRKDTWGSTENLVRGDHPRQAYFASTDDGVVAWAETASVRLDSSNWRIFTRGTDGKVALLARSEDVFDGQLPLINGDASPVVHDGRVYWSTAAPADGANNSFTMQVQSRAVGDTGPPIVEAHGASQPAITADGLFVVRSSRDTPAVEDGEATVQRVVEPGTQDELLTYTGPAGTTLQGLVGDGEHLAVVRSTQEDTGGVIYVFATGGDRRAISIPLASSGRTTLLALCDGRLVWNSADGSGQLPDEPQYVMDLRTLNVARLEVPNNYTGSYCAGDLVGWRSLSDPSALATTTVVRWAPTR